MKKTLCMLLIAVTCLLLCTACSAKKTPQELILGAWTQHYGEAKTVTVGGKEYKAGYHGSQYSKLMFQDNGKVDYGDLVPGSYSISETAIVFQEPYGRQLKYNILELTESRLVLEIESYLSEGGTIELAYVYHRP